MTPRYGHSITACGPGHAWLLVFGGMQQGGYGGERNDVWVLRAAGSVDGATVYEWFCPPTSRGGGGGGRSGGSAAAAAGGPAPRPRGYHSACASADGRRVFIFGGISGGDSCDELAVLDTHTWEWQLPGAGAAAEGADAEAPCGRFGASATLFDGGVWLLGGGTGGDLLRAGRDLSDVWRLDTEALTWARVAPKNAPPYAANLGRCHSAARVGAKLLLFGGSAHTCGRVSWLDLASCTFGAPRVAPLAPAPAPAPTSAAAALLRRVRAPPAFPDLLPGHDGAGAPCARFTHMAALMGTTMVLSSGWTYGSDGARRGCLGDVWQLNLAPDAPSRARAAQQPPAAAPGGGALDGDMDDMDDDDGDDDDDDDGDEDFDGGDDDGDDDAEEDGVDDLEGYGEEDEGAQEEGGASGSGGGDEGDAAAAGGDAAVERRLVRALVAAMDAADMVAVRRLLRRVQLLRQRRANAAGGVEPEPDEM
jgi:hypothetical protein